MKVFLYKIFYPRIYKRWKDISLAQKKRIKCILALIGELNKWWDIPLDFQRGSASRILKFPDENTISLEFLKYINKYKNLIGIEDIVAKSLPLSWYKK